MFETIQSRISGRFVLATLFLATLFYVTMLGYSVPKLLEYSSGLPLFDLSPFGYSHGEALRLLQALGEPGREFYGSTQLLLDSFYPGLFGIAYFALFQWILKRGGIRHPLWSWLSLLPVAAGVFDYAENGCIWLMLKDFPELTSLQVQTAAALTIVKSMLTTLYFAALLVLVSLVAVRRVRR